MNVITTRFGRFVAACLSIALAACGGGGSDGDGSGARGTPITRAVGGTVVAGDATLVIPAGSLSQDTTISVSISNPSPNLPQSQTLRGMIFDFGPNGTTFLTPATLTLPLVGTPAANERAVIAFLDPASNQWVDLPSTVANGSISAPLTHFTVFAQRFTGLDPGLPVRTWFFSQIQGDGSTKFLSGSTQIFGTLNATIDFGPAFNDQPIVIGNGLSGLQPPDEIATGQIFSSEFGGTFFVSAEAPSKINLVADSPIGNHVLLNQLQSFVRDGENGENASLTFDVTDLDLEATDLNHATNLSFAECPTTPCPDLITAMVALRVEARTERLGIIYDATGVAQIRGDSRGWTHSTDRGQFFCPDNPNSCRNPFFGTIQLWDDLSVAQTSDVQSTFIRLQLKQHLPFSIDLANVLDGETVTLEIVATAKTLDRRAGSDRQSSAYAHLRDPRSIGGVALTPTGLRATSQHVPALPIVNLIPPARCVAGPGPAGSLQFSAASYSVAEWADGEQAQIRVTRTGGSTGAVSATFSTSDATAIAGADYTPVQMTVAFADGDAAPKVLIVPIIHDGVAEPDKTLNLTLSEPGGCATLGTQASAGLTILDDDRLPPPPPPSGLDPSFGNAGKAAMPETGAPLRGFGGDRSAMALQADGKIVMVGGTFTDFILARFNADGSLDTGFGIGGKVTTDMGGGPFEQEEALGVAIQSDGRIVVVGHTSIPTSPPAPNLPPTFALARYTSDGKLDPSFGSGGRVSANVNGIAYAVAIQPDGKIVVAGEFSFVSSNGSDFSDFTVARFNTNGSLDLGFGGSGTGQVATDIGSSSNSARNLVLQPNGAIVVSGKPQSNRPGFDHTDIARYTASGVLDTSFGSGGKLTLAGVDVGQGLARQADGKFVLTGSVIEATVPATARFQLKRLNVNGSPDTAFGNAGTVDTAFTQSATAAGVALQGDGKILVVGTRAFSVNANFIVARYNSNGSVDTGFGSDGNLSIDFFGLNDIGENVLVQPDGKIVVSGQAQHNFDGYGLARINP